MLSAHDARQLSIQALTGRLERIRASVDKVVHQAALRGDRDAQVVEPLDSQVLDDLLAKGYSADYYHTDGGGYYYISW